MAVVKENTSVILQRGNVLKAMKLERGKKLVFEKLHFTPDNAIGEPFNSCYEVVSGKLRKIEPSMLRTDAADVKEPADMPNKMDCVEDNRLLVDTHGESQSLKREEIIDMKAKGAKGEDIVEEIVKNSASFHGKTTYSQDKYLKKKKSKHLAYIKIRKPCARLLCKMYERREPAKICQMKLDTMSQIMTMANVHSGSRVIVVETCSGLILGLTMERLGGDGAVVNLHAGEAPSNFFAINHFNFPEEYWGKLHSLPLSKLGYLFTNKTFAEAFGSMQNDESLQNLPENKELENNQHGSATITDIKPEAQGIAGTASDQVQNPDINDTTQLQRLSKKGRHCELTPEEKNIIRTARRNKKLRHQQSAWNLLQIRDMDTLIVACKFHPTPLVLTLLEFVAPSRPFVVYCENREPLVELFVQLSISAKALNVKISETFTRQYQVLPERTHPHVMLGTSGGYLLTGITVESKKRLSDETRAAKSVTEEVPSKKPMT